MLKYLSAMSLADFALTEHLGKARESVSIIYILFPFPAVSHQLKNEENVRWGIVDVSNVTCHAAADDDVISRQAFESTSPSLLSCATGR